MSDMLGLVFKEGLYTFSRCEHCEDTIFLRLHSRSYDKWSAHGANMGAWSCPILLLKEADVWQNLSPSCPQTHLSGS